MNNWFILLPGSCFSDSNFCSLPEKTRSES